MKRENIIRKYVKGKKVLDIGCVSNKKKGDYKFGKLHEFIRKHSDYVTGMDINKEGVQELNKRGFKVVYGNAETFELNKKFDVIVAGELIEHLDNQGLFLKASLKHLKNEGRLIITTPNCFGARYHIRNFLGNLDVNKQHTIWHDRHTLSNIVRRIGFVVEKIAYTYDDHYTFKSKIERLFCIKKSLRPQLVLIARKK